MKKDNIVVKRYADAYMAFSKETIGLEKSIEELKVLKNVVIHENPGFLEFLLHEGIGHDEKFEFVEKVLNDQFSDELKSFLKMLLEKERIDYLLDIIEFVRVKYSLGPEVEALLMTSFPLDTDLIRTIEDKLQEKMNKKFKFYIDLDASLLGGVVVVMANNSILDGSVRKRLFDLKEKLRGARV